MILEDIKVGTVGGNDWEYKNASPYAISTSVTVRPVTIDGLAVPKVYGGDDYSGYLVTEMSRYVNKGDAVTTAGIKKSYPRYSIKGPKICAIVPNDATDSHTTYTIVCYDGSTNTIRNAKYSDYSLADDENKTICTSWAHAAGIGVWYKWDGASILHAGDDDMIIDLGEYEPSYEKTFWLNTIPVFRKNEGDYQGYLQSSDPDPTNFGGYLNFSDYIYEGEDVPTGPINPDTPGDIIEGLFTDLGFSLSTGPLRGAIIDDANLNALATKLGKGWFADNVGNAIVSIKCFKTPGHIEASEILTELIPATTFDATSISGYPITNQFQRFSFGSYIIQENFNSFLDYTNTDVSVYLPFVGIKSLDTQLTVGSKLTFDCGIDYITGTVIWIISVTRDGVTQALYDWNGNCSMEIPLSSIDYAQKVTQALTGIASIASGVVGGMAGGISKNTIDQVGGGAIDLVKASSNDYVSMGNISSNYGWVGIMYPYLIFKRSKPNYPSNYNENLGKPSMKQAKLSDLNGYTKVAEIHLDNINCLEDERVELLRLLKDGVIL